MIQHCKCCNKCEITCTDSGMFAAQDPKVFFGSIKCSYAMCTYFIFTIHTKIMYLLSNKHITENIPLTDPEEWP